MAGGGWRLVFLGGLVLALIPVQAIAAPPSNDTCDGVTSVPLGTTISGSTAEATDNYQATNVASGGADVAYRVTVPSTSAVIVNVEAVFATSLYASAAACGGAQVWNGGHSLRITNSGGTQAYSVIVDGIANDERGGFRVTVNLESAGSQPTSDNSIVGSVLAGLDGLATSILAAIEQARADLAGRLDGLTLSTYRNWTFAAGSTRKGFRQQLSLLSETAQTVVVTFLTNKGTKTKPVRLRADRPKVINVNRVIGKKRDVSMKISAPSAVFAERIMRFRSSALDVSAGEHD